MRDTKEYWQDVHDQVENVIYKGHADRGWLWRKTKWQKR